jgi:MFS family permease
MTQTASLLQALVLWFLLITGHMSVPAILILSLIIGLINAIDIPARQSFVLDMVEKKEDLGNAIALNSSMVHGARMIGPAIAGILIVWVGEASCFLLNALSFMAVIISFLRMNIKPRIKHVSKRSLWFDMKDGFNYVAGHLPMRSIMILIALISLSGMPYMVFMTVFAKDIFHGSPYTLGFLLGSSGMGALAGSVYLASREGIKGFGRLMAASAALFGLGLMSLGLSKILWVSYISMAFVGFGMMMIFALSNTILQTIVEDNKRGRVMSIYTVCFMGMTPIGNYIQGWLAHHFGVPVVVFFGGVVCLLAALNFARHLPAIREVMHQSRSKQSTEVVPDPAA